MEAKRMYSRVGNSIPVALFIGVLILSLGALLFFRIEYVPALPMSQVGAFLLIMGLMCFSTVVAPIALLPLIPVFAPLVGPFITALACWAGWTLGAVIAFLLARHGGRPLLVRFVAEEKLLRLEARIPRETRFALIVALRLVIPVDILSYVLGLVSQVSIGTYTLASAIGIAWFSFAFSYLGNAFFMADTVLFALYSVVSAIIFGGALWYVRKSMRRENGGD